MSTEPMPFRDVRYSFVTIGVSCTSNFWWLQKRQFEGLRSEERGGQATGSLRSIHLSGYDPWRWLRIANEKCGGAPSCMKHTVWCALAGTPYIYSRKACCKKTRYFEPLKHSGSVRIRLATLVWPLSSGSSSSRRLQCYLDFLRRFATAFSLVICCPHATYYHPSELVGRIWQHPI
ncbi:hypothetical protein TNCV_2489341 [Trichonephila clavipes]|nr:hypothetical protein TNCV_2489341 [Trichonephila clavipes]